MSMLVLHLSDLHIKVNSDIILSRHSQIAACLNNRLHEVSLVVIVVTGDVAFSGKVNEYVIAELFFKKLIDDILAEKNVAIKVVFSPGNHDCDFTKSDTIREICIKQILSNDPPLIDDKLIDACTIVNNEFYKFRDVFESENCKLVDDKLCRVSVFNCEGKEVCFISYNVSWLSTLDEKVGQLLFPVDRYGAIAEQRSALKISIFHHPYNWFGQGGYRNFKQFVKNTSDIVLSGHEHTGDIGKDANHATNNTIYLEGKVLYESSDLSKSSFYTIHIDLEKDICEIFTFIYKKSAYIQDGNHSYERFMSGRGDHINPFLLNNEFEHKINDAGAYLRHPGSIGNPSIVLSDIYIFPDLKNLTKSFTSAKQFLNSNILLKLNNIADGVIVEGEEKIGKTSLLFQIYRSYHEHGLVPLYINGKSIKSANDKHIENILADSFAAQYVDKTYEMYMQLQSDKKVLLLDDFDSNILRSGHARASVLAYLRKRYKYIVVTVNELFEMRGMLESDKEKQINGFIHYRLLPFSYTLRNRLTRKWFSVCNDATVSDAEYIARCDSAEKLMDEVMSKSIVPKIPLFLLTLLQGIDGGQSSELKSSGFGHYYHYLISQSLKNAGIKPDRFTEIFEYCANLAWELTRIKAGAIDEFGFREFNAKFSAKWHTVDFETRRHELLAAKILINDGDCYMFKYPYIFYYFKGHYIKDNLDKEMCVYLEHCCRHLYVRDNANTILFASHHTADHILLINIADVLASIFKSKKELSFEEDTSVVLRIVDDTCELRYLGGTPIEHREAISEQRDDLDDGTDGLADQEETTDELSLIAKLVTMFKTMEILGQILKNQYSKIQKPEKRYLLEQIYSGPLRALSDFYDYLKINPESLISEIENELNKKTKEPDIIKRNEKARKIASNIIRFVTFAFLHKAAQTTNSDTLLEDIHAVSESKDVISYKLIELGVLLDSPKPLPRRQIEKLLIKANGNHLVEKTVAAMLLNRLYLFRTDEKDMQWLSSNFKHISIETQHAITYQNDSKTRLKS